MNVEIAREEEAEAEAQRRAQNRQREEQFFASEAARINDELLNLGYTQPNIDRIISTALQRAYEKRRTTGPDSQEINFTNEEISAFLEQAKSTAKSTSTFNRRATFCSGV